MMRKYLYGILVLLSVSACEKKEAQTEQVRPVKAMQIEEPSKFILSNFTGRAEATQELNLGFPEAGTMIGRPVFKGDNVKRGDVLAWLDPRDFKSGVDAAQAEYERSQAQHERIVEALKYNAVAKQDLSDALARLAASKANLEIKQKALEEAKLIAPFNGVISWTYKEPFQRVTANEVVLRLLDISKIELTLSIPETMIPYAPYVESVDLVFDSFPNHVIKSKVKNIGTEATAATRTYPMTLIFDQPKDIMILPGMTATTKEVAINPKVKEVSLSFTLPMTSVFTVVDPDKRYVWIVDTKMMAVHKKEIKIIKTTPQGVWVTGLAPGEWIVIAGVYHLQEGQQVKLL
jgi:RND family efflux transporter MFP subunit